MNNEEKLVEFLKNNNGYVSTSELLNLNIYKSQIDFYINKGIIERVSHGLYMDTRLFKDEYFILQKKIQKIGALLLHFIQFLHLCWMLCKSEIVWP